MINIWIEIVKPILDYGHKLSVDPNVIQDSSIMEIDDFLKHLGSSIKSKPILNLIKFL